MQNTHSSRGSCCRFWFTTENVPKDSPLFGLENLATLPKGVSYAVWQLETGSGGHTHYQGYVELSKSQFITWLKSNISKTARWEARKGTAMECKIYCTKEKTRVRGPWELGTMSKGPGTRTDLIDFRDSIRKGMNNASLWDDHCTQMARFRHMCQDIRRTCKPPDRNAGVNVVLFVGPTGSGKTRMVKDKWRSKGYFDMPISNGTLWFDGYDGEHRVLIDDFGGRTSKISLVNTLRILDRYVVLVPIKNGHVWWNPKRIAITSNIHPRDWYDWGKREEQFHALARRFSYVVKFRKDGTHSRMSTNVYFTLHKEYDVRGVYPM